MIISDYFTEEEYKNPAFENIMKMARAYNMYQGVTPLHKANLLVSAINEDHVELVKALVAFGVNIDSINNRGTFPLLAANNVTMVTLLLDLGADINLCHKDSALIKSVRYGNDEVLNLLIARGVEINNNNSNGFNALMLAAMQNDHEFVQILLEAGADASIQGFTGQTAYDLAKFSELKKVVAIFDNFNLNKIAKSSIKLTNNELLATRKKRI